MTKDLRIAFRKLMKSPGFTVTAILTLALGIGANAVVFSVLNAVVLRPVNVPHAQNLYTVQRFQFPSQSYPDFIDLRDRNRTFEGLATYSIVGPVGVDSGGSPSIAWPYLASGDYFDTLEIQPYLGRFYHASDEKGTNSAPYLVLSYAYWRGHFHGDAGVVGRTVQINKHQLTIIGVAPPGFRGTELFFAPAFWIPMVEQPTIEGYDELVQRGNHSMFAVGRLKAGATPAKATADLNTIGAALAKTYPTDDDGLKFTLARPGLIGDMLGGPARAFMAGLMLLAGLILLAACANLGSLFAARAADRAKEVALRLALGASRNRILRTLFTEAILISLMGGAVGLLLSVMLLGRLNAWQPLARFPMHVPVNPDANVYVVALALAVVSGLLFGIVPVRQVLRTDPYQIVKSGSRSSGTPGRRITVRDLLLVVQVAICAVLVMSSLVAVRGLARSLDSRFGFEPRNALLVQAYLHMAGYSDDNVPAIQKRLLDAVQSTPGVSSAALVDNPPLVEGWNAERVFSDRTTDLRPANAAVTAIRYRISPEYLPAAETTLLTGRNFSPHDDKGAPRVAVVNREFARSTF